jgi:transposase InsO family protein
MRCPFAKFCVAEKNWVMSQGFMHHELCEPGPYRRDPVKGAFRPTRVNMIWTSDITYFHSGDGFAHKCAIRDEYSERIVGCVVASQMRDELVIM